MKVNQITLCIFSLLLGSLSEKAICAAPAANPVSNAAMHMPAPAANPANPVSNVAMENTVPGPAANPVSNAAMPMPGNSEKEISSGREADNRGNAYDASADLSMEKKSKSKSKSKKRSKVKAKRGKKASFCGSLCADGKVAAYIEKSKQLDVRYNGCTVDKEIEQKKVKYSCKSSCDSADETKKEKDEDSNKAKCAKKDEK